MKIALICEKPSVAKAIAGSIATVYPNIDTENFYVAFASEYDVLNYSFLFPRGLRYTDYPYVSETCFKGLTFGTRGAPPHKYQIIRSRDDFSLNASTPLDHQSFTKAALQCDLILVAQDYSPSGNYVRLRVQEWLDSFPNKPDVMHVNNILSYDQKHLTERTMEARPQTIATLNELAKSSICKRHFDFNYLVNAISIHGETARFALNRSIEGTISKNALQVLYYMSQIKTTNDGLLIHTMSRWKGTGRYTLVKEELGSGASRMNIIGMLLENRLLERNEKKLLISNDGRRFLSALHPDSEDPDQIFRIHQWSQLPIEEGRAKVDRYIRTFFGRQKRFLANLRSGQVAS